MSETDITDRIAEILTDCYSKYLTDSELREWAANTAEELSSELGLTEFSQPDQLSRCWITKRWLKDD